MSAGNRTVIRDPVIAWCSELDSAVPPRPEPPPVPFTVTRSEVVITPSRATVHIWCAARQAIPRTAPMSETCIQPCDPDCEVGPVHCYWVHEPNHKKGWHSSEACPERAS